MPLKEAEDLVNKKRRLRETVKRSKKRWGWGGRDECTNDM